MLRTRARGLGRAAARLVGGTAVVAALLLAMSVEQWRTGAANVTSRQSP